MCLSPSLATNHNTQVLAETDPKRQIRLVDAAEASSTFSVSTPSGDSVVERVVLTSMGAADGLVRTQLNKIQQPVEI